MIRRTVVALVLTAGGTRLPAQDAPAVPMPPMIETADMPLAADSAAPAPAPPAPSTNHTVITSDHLVFNYQQNSAVFTGNVVVVDPQLRIESRQLNVLFEGTNSIRSATAIGDVRLYHQDKAATCDKAVYLARSGQVILAGNARLTQDPDSIEGRKITFWLNEDRMDCEPAYLVIFTKDEGEGEALPSTEAD